MLKETGDAVESVEITTREGEFKILNRKELSFGYRSSPFQGMRDLAAITAVTFQLKFSESAKKNQQEYLQRWPFFTVLVQSRIMHSNVLMLAEGDAVSH